MNEWNHSQWRPRRVWPFVVVAIALIVLVLLWEVAS